MGNTKTGLKAFRSPKTFSECAGLYWTLEIMNHNKLTYFGSFNYEKHSIRFNDLGTERKAFSLHELQNFMYYITGHELEVKL